MHMSQLHVGEQLQADCSPTHPTFPDGSIYRSSDNTCRPCESPQQAQIVAMDVDEIQADRHTTWATGLPTPEVTPHLRSGTEGNLTLSSSLGLRMFPRPTRG